MNIRAQHDRGFALVIVLAVIALAAVLGYAMLTTASLSAQIDTNTSGITSSETLAESGVELAAFYLQHPQNAPVLNTDGYWAGGINISLGGTLKIDSVTVTRTAPNKFTVTSTASGGITSSSRTIKARLYVESSYIVKNAIACNGDFDLSRAAVTVTAANASLSKTIRVDGTLQVASSLLGTIVQAVSSTLSTVVAVPTYPPAAVPLCAELNNYDSLPAYTYNGSTYMADELTVDPGATLLTSNLALNPANVWYSTTSRKINSTTTINGTLILRGDSTDLEVKGTLRIRPISGMPALMTARELKLSQSTSLLDAEGLVWVGKEINSADGVLNILTGLFAKPTIQIQGALMLAHAGSAMGSGFRGNLKVTFTPDNLNLPNLTTVGQTPTSVKVLSWQ